MSQRDLGPMPQQHPRTAMFRSAKHRLSDFLWELLESHQLTSCELLILLNEQANLTLRSALHSERYPSQEEDVSGGAGLEGAGKQDAPQPGGNPGS